MKNPVSKFVITAALLLGFNNCFAQIGIGIGSGGFGMGMNIPLNNRHSQRNSDRLENQVQQLRQDLNLNDEQVVKVRGLLIERDRARNRSGRNAITSQQFDQRMNEILTPEQYTKYNDLKQQKRESKKENKKDDKKDSLPESEWDDVYR